LLHYRGRALADAQMDLPASADASAPFCPASAEAPGG